MNVSEVDSSISINDYVSESINEDFFNNLIDINQTEAVVVRVSAKGLFLKKVYYE